MPRACVLRYSDSLTTAEMQVWREKTASCVASLGRAQQGLRNSHSKPAAYGLGRDEDETKLAAVVVCCHALPGVLPAVGGMRRRR